MSNPENDVSSVLLRNPAVRATVVEEDVEAKEWKPYRHRDGRADEDENEANVKAFTGVGQKSIFVDPAAPFLHDNPADAPDARLWRKQWVSVSHSRNAERPNG